MYGLPLPIPTGFVPSAKRLSPVPSHLLSPLPNGLARTGSVPDKGYIEIDGITLRDLKYNQLQKLRSKIGMVFQSGALFDSLTVNDNIKIALDRLTNLDKNPAKFEPKKERKMRTEKNP